MKKIIYIVTQSSWGGAQKYIYDLACALRNQFDITVLAGEGDGALLAKLSGQGVNTYFLPLLKREINPYSDILAMRQIKKILKQGNFDIVHLNSTKASIIASSVANSLKTPGIIYTAHGFVFNEPMTALKKLFYVKCERFTSKFKDKIICVSEHDRLSAILNKIAPPEKLITIHNGLNINQEEFIPKNEARKALNLENDWKIFGTVANFYPTKALDHLIMAFNKSGFKQDAHLVIIGDGALRQAFEHLIHSLSIKNNIHLLGEIKDAHKYLKAFDFFVLSSVKEGLPYVISEAMAAQLPIISTDVGGIKEIMRQDSSHLFVDPEDVDGLSRAMKKIFEIKTMDDQYPPSFDEMIKKTLKVYSKFV